MMVKLSISVMAHPVRRKYVEAMLERLDYDPPISWDREGPPSPDRARRWRVGRAAWEMAEADADWHMVLQDDIKVCRDLHAGLAKALEHVEQPCIVQPYFGRHGPGHHTWRLMGKNADRDGAHWLRKMIMTWGVAICVPTWSIPKMLEWCTGQDQWVYDQRIGQYYWKVMGWDTLHTHPSLVDHLDLPSLVGHQGKGRHAYKFHEGSALDLEWSSRPLDDPRISRARKLAQYPVRTRSGPSAIPWVPHRDEREI